MKSDYLIIGQGPAGVNAIEGIRLADRTATITAVTSEKESAYSRPLISYYLGGKVKRSDVILKTKDFYRKNKVRLLLNKKVESVSAAARKVTFEDGTEEKFGKLLIATGTEPFVPPVAGLDKIKHGVFTFTSMADADALLEYLKKNGIKKAVVMGGGLIGLKCTEGLIDAGVRVTVVELGGRILANTFDAKASVIIEKKLKEAGCGVRKKDTVVKAAADSKGTLKEVRLKKGKKIQTSLLIAAAGVRPNIGFLKGSGIDTGRGIVTDPYLETNVRGVFAAGDSAEVSDFFTGGTSVMAIWPVAARTGRIAGFNMASKKKIKYEGGFIMNSVELAGVPTVSFGRSAAVPEGAEVLEKYSPEKNEYRKIVLSDSRVVGAIFVGNIERAGIFSGIIRDRLDVSGFREKLLDEDFGLLILPKDYRKQKIKSPEISVFN